MTSGVSPNRDSIRSLTASGPSSRERQVREREDTMTGRRYTRRVGFPLPESLPHPLKIHA